MSEDKSKLQLIGEITEADSKNLELIEEINNREDEIERLTKQNKALNEMYELTKKEYIRLNNKVEELMTLYTTEREVKDDYKNIIKEVREYIENNNIYSNKKIDDILEILDKENK